MNPKKLALIAALAFLGELGFFVLMPAYQESNFPALILTAIVIMLLLLIPAKKTEEES